MSVTEPDLLIAMNDESILFLEAKTANRLDSVAISERLSESHHQENLVCTSLGHTSILSFGIPAAHNEWLEFLKPGIY